jgi:hypothetical protein
MAVQVNGPADQAFVNVKFILPGQAPQAELRPLVRQGAAKAKQVDQRKDDNNPVGDGEYGVPARCA